MTLSIVILSFNTKRLTQNCLESIYRWAPRFPFEIIVVDNASADGSAQMVLKNFPKVKLITNKKNLGYAKANNQAVKTAKGKFVLLLNSDTKIQKGNIEGMVSYLKIHPEVGAATAKLINPNGSTQYYYHRKFPNFAYFLASMLKNHLGISTKLARDYFMLEEKFDRETEIEQAGGAVMLIESALIKKIGGLFDNRFPLFFNDTDLCKRISYAGLKVMLLPDVAVIHYRGKSTDLLDPFIIREELFVSMLRYFRKHRMYASYLLTKLSLIPMLFSVFLLTLLGISYYYLGLKEKNRLQSLGKQIKILLSVIIELPQLSPFR